MAYLNMLTQKLRRFAILGLVPIAIYAPAKDTFHAISSMLAKSNIEIVDASFGTQMPWQQKNLSYLKVSQIQQPKLSTPQIIYTKLKFENPTATPQTYRKIWLTFTHKNGDQEYTTDYTLYNPQTRQRLIGKSIELGAKSTVEVIAAYRFIPSYRNKVPDTMSVSWQGDGLLRETACQYQLSKASNSYFDYQCNK